MPEIKVINKGGTMVFLMAGEQLIGAKQNRVINASMMVPAKGEIPVPVSCVERGRWGYRSRAFRGSGSSSHGTLRRMMSRHAHEGYRKDGRPSSRQGEVWAEVDHLLHFMGSVSPSDALEQVYEDRAEQFRKVIEQASVPSGCHGVLFATGGCVAGVDLFDKPSTLSKLLPKLVKACPRCIRGGQGRQEPGSRRSARVAPGE